MRSINHQVDIAREHIRFADRAAAFPITTVAMPPAMTLPPSSWSAHPLHRVSIVSLKNARQRYTEASIAYREFLGDRELERARKLTEQVLRHARALDHMLDPFTRVLAALRTKYAEHSVAREHHHAHCAHHRLSCRKRFGKAGLLDDPDEAALQQLASFMLRHAERYVVLLSRQATGKTRALAERLLSSVPASPDAESWPDINIAKLLDHLMMLCNAGEQVLDAWLPSRPRQRLNSSGLCRACRTDSRSRPSSRRS